MRVLLVISEAPPVHSGIARVAEKLGAGLREHGHSIDTLSLNQVPRYEYGEVRLSSMPFKLRSIRKELPHYDLIHLHGPVPTFSDVFLLRGLHGLGAERPPLVYTYHAPIDLHTYPLKLLTTPYNMVHDRLVGMADHVVVTTPSYKQRLSRYVAAEKLSVVPWGVDCEKFVTDIDKPDPFTVLYLGQIRPYKGLPVLLEACAELPDVRLWIVGNGHCATTTRRRADELGLSNVTFWGSLSDEECAQRLREAHAIVLPSVSRSEAFGIALLEGMAAGCVPVASHLPGVANVIGNEGFTFPPGDYRALRSILANLRDDRALRLHMAGLAQAKARLYPWERVTFEYDSLYRRVAAGRRRDVPAPAASAVGRAMPQALAVPVPIEEPELLRERAVGE